MVRRGAVDGLVLTATRRRGPRIELLLETGVPFLTLGGSETPGDDPWIDLDFEGVTAEAIDRLVALSHRDVAVAAPAGHANLALLFVQAAARALGRHGLASALLVQVPSGEPGGVDLAGLVAGASRRPTAIVICSEPVVAGLYSALGQTGLAPVWDLSVISLGDAPQRRHPLPTPCCFGLDLRHLGEALA